MQTFNLRDEWTSLETEQALIAAIAQDPALYWELLDTLPADVFAFDETGDAWREIATAIEAEKAPALSSEWAPASDPQAAARRLADLLQRRLLAQAMETVASELYGERPAAEVLTGAEEAIARAQAAIRATQAGKLTWAAELIGPILQDAEERRRQREETGQPVMGLLTGIAGLDAMINGLNQGLYILGGAPGMGKTTLALQMAAAVARRGTPVVYVTFENSPANLATKAIAGRAGINPQDVARGWADVKALRKAAEEWRPAAERLALIEGTDRLTVAQIRALALRAMNRAKAEQCLIVVDYLQMMGKAGAEFRSLATVRERVEVLGAALRELSTRLGSPVLALASQNRAQGNYGGGKGAAALDSLKESGDLEYSADVILFLTQDEKRPTTPPARAIDLTIAKNRHGDTGKVPLIFRPDLSNFGEVDWRHGQ